MNRRDFLEKIGVGAGVLLIDPSSFIAKTPAVKVYKDYPELYFTGLKQSMTNTLLCGQFLWTVEYEDMKGKADRTFWYQNVGMDQLEVDRAKDLPRLIRVKSQLALQQVVEHMDKSIEDASHGLVQTAQYEQIPNPQYDPSLPDTTIYDDEYETWNPKTINGKPIMKPIRSMRFGKFPYGQYDAWDIDRLVTEICTHRALQKGTWKR